MMSHKSGRVNPWTGSPLGERLHPIAIQASTFGEGFRGSRRCMAGFTRSTNLRLWLHRAAVASGIKVKRSEHPSVQDARQLLTLMSGNLLGGTLTR